MALISNSDGNRGTTTVHWLLLLKYPDIRSYIIIIPTIILTIIFDFDFDFQVGMIEVRYNSLNIYNERNFEDGFIHRL